MLDSIVSKLDKIFTELGFKILTFISTGHNKWRKPSPKMFEYLIENYAPELMPSKCVYTGDAAGRDFDFSDDDLKFAFNCGMRFRYDNLITQNVSIEVKLTNKFINYMCEEGFYDEQLRNCNQCVIMIGRPASGKSILTSRLRLFKNYEIVS
jgi:histidinol phosphatase-like enzyme